MSVDPVSLAITVALNVASMAMTASKHIEGPRLTDLKASTADYGTPMVQFYGTMRLEAFTMYIEDIREVKHQNKTKGGKYDEFTYFGTWASFIADNHIDLVLQIFLDRNLYYDTTGTGGPTTAVAGGTFRVYNGTQTEPDPRLLAKIEAKEGPGTCPAYINISYVVFEEFPLQIFGNRYPQTSIVATRAAVPKYPWEFTPAPTTFLNQRFSPDGSRLYSIAADMMVWDVATRTMILYQTLSPGIGVDTPYAFASDGIYATDITGHTLFRLGYDGGIANLGLMGGGGWFNGIWAAGGQLLLAPGSFAGMSQAFASVPLVSVGVNYYATSYFTATDGRAIGVGTTSGHVLAIGEAYRPSDGATFGNATLIDTTAYGSGGLAYGFDNGTNFVIRQGNYLFLTTRTAPFSIVLAVDTAGAGAADPVATYTAIDPGAAWWWDGAQKRSSADLSVLETFSIFDYPGSVRVAEVGGTIYSKLNNAMLSSDTIIDPGIIWRYLDRKDGTGWLLGDICADVAEQCGMDPLRFDFSALDQTVPGYAWTQGPGKQVVGALLDLHDSDIRGHGFVQQGLKRGQPYAAGTITTDWMVNENRGQGAGASPLYSIPITSETDMPLRIAVTFADPNMEYQPNTATAQRDAAAVKTNREVSIDLQTYNDQPDSIAPLAERALRRYWIGAVKPTFLLTPLEIRLEPGDVRPLQLEDGELLRVRNTKATIRANRMIETEWEVDGETLVNPPDWQFDTSSPINVVFSTPGGFTYGRDPDTLVFSTPSKLFVFDTPLLEDADNQTSPFLYDAAGPYGAGGSWFGTTVWEAPSNEADTVFVGDFDLFTSAEPATFGFCQGTLPNVAADVMDEATVLIVGMAAGASLSSVTTDQLLADRSLNLALVGSELIQFRDATEVALDQWRLTGLIRGARCTEYAVAGHAANEGFLLITSKVHKRSVGAGQIGVTDFYKASLTGQDLDSQSAVEVDFAANAHRPPSPAHLELVRDTATGDWAISWTRRSRIGGNLIDGRDVPLGETSEAYRVKIMNGSTVLATYEAATQSFTYLRAAQVTDWGSAQTSLTVEVCQMSPALSLEGFTSTASA